ncbi:hypothetical protein GLYMA_20G093100v4 [Glycine max]|uniref:Uncharacterized protein n=1 Tax=Glycine max TaxID=3847 RepID=K7N2I1_SOYBN|nr:hypothetical protein GYH30_055334 [Glycine max]KRG90472.1 hypothetical protein GLYMA_20G093100v4 [Glycine max]
MFIIHSMRTHFTDTSQSQSQLHASLLFYCTGNFQLDVCVFLLPCKTSNSIPFHPHS